MHTADNGTDKKSTIEISIVEYDLKEDWSCFILWIHQETAFASLAKNKHSSGSFWNQFHIIGSSCKHHCLLATYAVANYRKNIALVVVVLALKRKVRPIFIVDGNNDMLFYLWNWIAIKFETIMTQEYWFFDRWMSRYLMGLLRGIHLFLTYTSGDDMENSNLKSDKYNGAILGDPDLILRCNFHVVESS